MKENHNNKFLYLEIDRSIEREREREREREIGRTSPSPPLDPPLRCTRKRKKMSSKVNFYLAPESWRCLVLHVLCKSNTVALSLASGEKSVRGI